MNSTAPTLFSGEYVLAVCALVDKVKGAVPENIVLKLAYQYGGEANERELRKHCATNTWGKTRQQLVDKQVISRVRIR